MCSSDLIQGAPHPAQFALTKRRVEKSSPAFSPSPHTTFTFPASPPHLHRDRQEVEPKAAWPWLSYAASMPPSPSIQSGGDDHESRYLIVEVGVNTGAWHTVSAQ